MPLYADAASNVPPPSDLAGGAYGASVPARSGKGPAAAPATLGAACWRSVPRSARPAVSVAEAAATAAAAAAAARQIGGIGGSGGGGGSGAGSFRQFRFREGATPPARQFATTTLVERQPADEDVGRFARLARLAKLARPLVERAASQYGATRSALCHSLEP